MICFAVRASADRAIPIASDIKIFSLCLIQHYSPSTQSSGVYELKRRRPELRLASPHHRNLTSTGISAGCPHCVVPLSRGAVTGQKYQYRLTGSLRNRLPQPAFRTDGYRFAPYLAVFDRSRKKETNEQKMGVFVFLLPAYRWSWRILRSRFSLLGSVS